LLFSSITLPNLEFTSPTNFLVIFFDSHLSYYSISSILIGSSFFAIDLYILSNYINPINLIRKFH